MSIKLPCLQQQLWWRLGNEEEKDSAISVLFQSLQKEKQNRDKEENWKTLNITFSKSNKGSGLNHRI